MHTYVTLISAILAMATWSTSAKSQSLDDGGPGLWTGLYAGVHLGGAWGKADGPDDIGSLELDGSTGGLHVGYNHQFGQIAPGSRFVAGLEGDFSWTGSDGSKSEQVDEFVFQLDNELNYLASIRGRFGIAMADFLFFGTAGVVFSEYDRTLAVSGPTLARTIRVNGSDKITGFVVGGGVEWKASRLLSMRAEALHYNFNDAKLVFVTNGARSATEVKVGQTVVRTALTFHLN